MIKIAVIILIAILLASEAFAYPYYDRTCLRAPLSFSDDGLSQGISNVSNALKHYSSHKRTKEILDDIFGTAPVVDTEILKGLLKKITKKYLMLVKRFKEESEKKESPFLTSMIYTDYYHRRSGWVLEAPEMAIGLYNFVLKRSTIPEALHALIFSISINPNTGMLSMFDPGSIVEDRPMWPSTFIHPRPIAGRLSLRVFYPSTKAFRDETNELVRNYVKREAKLLEEIRGSRRFIYNIDKAIKNKKHWLRVRNKRTPAELIRDRKYFEDRCSEIAAQLEQERKIIQKLKLACRERVVIREEIGDDAPIWEGFISCKDIGLESPLELLHRLNEIYPAVEKLLLEGKPPEKLGQGRLLLPVSKEAKQDL